MELYVGLNSILLFLSFTINLGLAIFIYLKNPRAETNRFLSYLLGAVSLWVLSFLLFLNVKQIAWVLLLRRLTPVGSGLVAGLLLYFSIIFPRPPKTTPRWLKWACLLPGLLFLVLSIFTSSLIKGFQISDVRYLFLGKPLFGWLYPYYSAYFVLYFFSGLVILGWKYFLARGREKLQIFYVLFGISVAGSLGFIVSLLLPLLGMPRLFTSGPPFTLIFAFFTTYAMVRYNLLDIEDFLRRGIFFLFATAAVVGALALGFLNLFNFVFSYFVILANLLLGLFVLVRNPKSKMNLSFWLITLAIVVWTVGVYLFWNMSDARLAFLGGKIAFLGAALIPAFLLFFSLVFPKELKPISPRQWGMILTPLIIAPVLIFSNQVLKAVTPLASGINRSYGPAYPVFLLYFLWYLGLFFFDLFLKERSLTGAGRVQVRYVFFGFGIASLIAVTTNLILPFSGIGAFSFVGPHATLFLVAMIAYAIVKHRLMSIEIIIQRSTVYGSVTLFIMAFYVLAVILSETFFRQFLGYSSFIITALAALLIAVFFQPLVLALQNLTDRLFFHGRYDYQKTLRRISQEIASVIKLEELTWLIVSSFVDTMKVSEISFLLLDKEREHFRSVPVAVARYKKIEIDVINPIVKWLAANKDILVKDEIEDQAELLAVREIMERLGVSVWVPIVIKDELIGIIALGNKLSGDIFTTEDLALLTTLASQTAVALDNARLYDEVLSMKNYNEEILQSMTNGVLTTDSHKRIVTYNYMAERITGRKLAEVMGKTCAEIWGERGAITTAVENTLKDRCYMNFETGLASPERGLVPVSLSSTLLRDSHGKKRGALLSIHDMTEVKELEGKVRQADKLAALATMAAGMAHEIKNPLSSMKVFSQLLHKKYDDQEFRKKLEEILPREIDRIDRIVESLLGFARATAPTFEPLKIEEVSEETLNYFADQALRAGVTIKKNYADLPPIEVDRGQISQVFSNLILNAIQAMPEGGELTVTTRPGKKIDDYLQNIKITVSDRGPGIPEEMQKKLFDPFFTTKYGGTGLGLTITHSIVDGHKGFIDVESKVGKGTVFTVTLPVSQGLL